MCVYICMATHICTCFDATGKPVQSRGTAKASLFFSPLCCDPMLALLSLLLRWAWIISLGQLSSFTARGFSLGRRKASLCITSGEPNILRVQYSNLSPGADKADWELDPLDNWFTRYFLSLLHEATGGLWLIQMDNCFCVTARCWVQIKQHGCLAVRTGPFFNPPLNV